MGKFGFFVGYQVLSLFQLLVSFFCNFFFGLGVKQSYLYGYTGGVRSASSSGALLGVVRVASSVDEFDGGPAFLRRYFGSIGAQKEFASKSNLYDLNYVLANPRSHRFFSSETPKKKSELISQTSLFKH